MNHFIHATPTSVTQLSPSLFLSLSSLQSSLLYHSRLRLASASTTSLENLLLLSKLIPITYLYIAHLLQQRHNSKIVIFKLLAKKNAGNIKKKYIVFKSTFVPLQSVITKLHFEINYKFFYLKHTNLFLEIFVFLVVSNERYNYFIIWLDFLIARWDRFV